MAENNVEAPLLPKESIEPSLVSATKRTIIRTKIVWTERYMTLSKSNAIIVRKYGIIPENILRQKTSFGLGDPRVNG